MYKLTISDIKKEREKERRERNEKGGGRSEKQVGVVSVVVV